MTSRFTEFMRWWAIARQYVLLPGHKMDSVLEFIIAYARIKMSPDSNKNYETDWTIKLVPHAQNVDKKKKLCSTGSNVQSLQRLEKIFLEA